MVGILTGAGLAVVCTLGLAWKWQFDLKRVAVFVVLVAGLAAAAVAVLASAREVHQALAAVAVWALATGACAAYVAFRFYRDPERVAPTDPQVIVSPADGTVIYVDRAEAGVVPTSTKYGRRYELHELTKLAPEAEDVTIVGISLNFLDVHVCRAPIGGSVVAFHHYAGSFGSLRDPEMAFANERATTVIDDGSRQVAVVQIASRLVRQVVSYVKEGDEVDIGQRIGAIRFGSQVDVIVPTRSCRIMVGVGQRVRAGETVMAVPEPAIR